MNPEMIPMLIQQGFRMIVVTFDVWGFSHFLHENLTKAREAAQKANETNVVVNGHEKAPES
jgi:hypothetical protein